MKRSILKIAALSLLAAAIAVAPSQASGQDAQKETKNGKAAADKADPAAKQKRGLPLNGKIAAVDKTAKSVTIGETTVLITSETRISKAGNPATLDDAVVGEEASAYYMKGDDGKLTARMLRIGPRPEGASGGQKGGGKKQGEKAKAE